MLWKSSKTSGDRRNTPCASSSTPSRAKSVAIDLRGYDPGSPVTPDQALERFLLALGIPIPNDVEAKSSLYRSLRADRRMLLLLDNAGISYSRVAAGITFPV